MDVGINVEDKRRTYWNGVKMRICEYETFFITLLRNKYSPRCYTKFIL